MAGCQIDVLSGDNSDIILKKKVSYKSKRFRDASRYTSKKISLKLLFLSDIFCMLGMSIV